MKFYKDAWDVEEFHIGDHHVQQREYFVNQNELNLFVDGDQNQQGLMIKTVADIAGAEVKVHHGA